TQGTIIRRDTGFWLSSIIMAALSMAVFGWLFNPDTQPFDLALVDEDHSQASRTLMEAFEGIDSVETREGSRDGELASLQDGDLGAVVIVPEGFEDELADGSASLVVYYDNSNPIRVGYATSTVKAVVDSYNEQFVGQSDAVKLSEQAVSTRNVSYMDFLTPGMVGMTIMWVNLGVGFLLVTWREQGILRRLGVTPLRPGSLIASQAVSFSIVSLMQTVIILTMGRLVFDVTVSGSYLWLAVTVVLGVAAMLSIGYVIASLLKSVTSVNAVINLVAFPMIFLGRSYFPLDPPPAVAPLVYAIPLTHLNDALREIVNHGGGLGDLWLSWLILAAWVVAGFGLSMRLFRWQ
ncbi:MAG: ABC transporter permease, partial [Dehalococcoidia bacterium]|nr:ABC transporter permease [Dehalococcoidia bacterium]